MFKLLLSCRMYREQHQHYKTVKIGLSIILCTALLFQSIGNVALFVHIRSAARKLAKQKIETSNPEILTRLIVHPNQLRWIHEKEFVFQGTMYDVVSKQKHQDSLHILAFRDDQETYAHQIIQKNLQTTTPLAAKSCNAAFIFKHLQTWPAVVPIYRSNNHVEWHRYKFVHYSSPLQQLFVGSPELPPPKNSLRIV